MLFRSPYQSQAQIEGIFAARAACQTNTSLPDFNPEPCGLDASGQALQQFFGLLVTVAIAIVSGILVGFVVKMPCLLPPGHSWSDFCKCGTGLSREYWFDDKHYWEVPEDDEEDESADVELQRLGDEGKASDKDGGEEGNKATIAGAES